MSEVLGEEFEDPLGEAELAEDDEPGPSESDRQAPFSIGLFKTIT